MSFAWVGIMLSVSACTAMYPPAVVRLEETAPSQSGALVVGRIVLESNGNGRKNAEFTWRGTGVVRIVVMPVDSDKAELSNVDENGWFYFHFRPGRYRFARVAYRDGAMISYKAQWWDMNLLFDVSDADSALYVGHLKVDIERGPLDLVDEESAARGVVAQRAPARSEGFAKRMMAPAPVDEANAPALDICAETWGLKCGRLDRGVLVVSPTKSLVAAGRPPPAGSLTPTLKWTSAPDPTLSYDVAVWSTITCHDPFFGANTLLGGDRVAYAAGISETQWQVTPALKPKTKYLWSVRLRRDNAVSTWSTQGRMAILPMASGVASGRLFQFETP